jgi:arsenate reductase (thioredoxin)
MDMKNKIALFTLAIVASANAFGQSMLFKKLNSNTSSISSEFDKISAERKETLSKVADELVKSKMNGQTMAVMFASADNSGTCQLAQAWLQVAADQYSISKLNVSSSGEKPTRISTSTIQVMKNAGFKVEDNTTFRENPRYLVAYSWDANRLMMFSKKADNFQNPSSGYVTIATESGIAALQGEVAKFELGYGNTVSNELSMQIAREMFFLAEKIQNKNLLSHQQ